MEQKDDNFGCFLIVLIIFTSLLFFFIHLIGNISKGEDYPVRRAIVETIDPSDQNE